MDHDGTDLGPDGTMVHAAVQVGDEVTAYVRAGRGRTVLVVGDARSGDLPSPTFVAALAREFRVVAPAHPVPDNGRGSRWICDIIDGLGLDRPALVFVGEAEWLGAFVEVHGDRVGAVVMVPGDPRQTSARHLAERIAAALHAAG
jgi:hypothetical protein